MPATYPGSKTFLANLSLKGCMRCGKKEEEEEEKEEEEEEEEEEGE